MNYLIALAQSLSAQYPSMATERQLVYKPTVETVYYHKGNLILKCGKCYKISNFFLFLFSNKIFVFMDRTHKMLVRIANREDPDQTASSEAV